MRRDYDPNSVVKRLTLVISVALALGSFMPQAAGAESGQITYLVGGDRTLGKTAAVEWEGAWVKNLSKAFARAADDLNAGGAITVTIKVAQGEYDGDLGSGAYQLPQFTNPAGVLIIEGGYDPAFALRNPFSTPSWITTIPERSAPLVAFARNSKLQGFIVDGMFFDTGQSNRYDSKTNSLLVGRSCTHPFFKFNYFETEVLAFENCTFMNSASRVMEPLIRAASDQAEIRYQNCMFVNNRIPLKLDSARFRNKPARIAVDHCSFVLNWAYNPDPGTGNPAALEIGPADAAREIQITNNLFQCNFGGAILALNRRMPALTISDNNFIGNGFLHGDGEPDAVAMIVTAGGRKHPLTVADIEDVPAVDEAEGNVSLATGIPLQLGDVAMVDSENVRAADTWANEVRRMLGMNLQGGTVAIRDYAPRQTYDPQEPPFPAFSAAAGYGATADIVDEIWQLRMASR
ncbi:MAG: hypothetical protein KAY32_16155 [Candidatus Eisenbacteria sp.]|nr:hypothetical protein [Candidatus Eisenbacteria bacterium]